MTRLLCLLAALSFPAPADAQIWVAPRRPGQSAVQYDPHEWRTIDLLVDEEIDGKKSAGVRLLFYEGERDVAERAAAEIVAAYRRLAREFRYVPDTRFPYVLYDTYADFLRTNLFPLQEGVLGVTSTRTLELTLPYFGDHRLFTEVGTHEMAHQFTIQKVRAAARHAKVARDPLQMMPLWFVEGLAEFYAQGPLSGKNAMVVRDVVTQPDLYVGHGMLEFYDDYPWSVVWTYQVGHARVTFLEEQYGAGTLQALLEASPWLVGGAGSFVVGGRRFEALVQKITGDPPHAVDAKFDDWIRRRAYGEWMEADQNVDSFEPLGGVRGAMTAFDASDDGRLVAYRSLERETGRSRIFVASIDGSRTRRVAAEGVPGTERLHAIEPRSFDLTNDALVYVAESRGRDLLAMRAIARERVGDSPAPAETASPSPPPRDRDEPWAVTDWIMAGESADDARPPGPSERIRLGREQRFRLKKHGIAGVFSPALGPDGLIAFVGLHEDGRRDVFVLDPRDRSVRRLTHDAHTERTLTWHRGRIVYSSDATGHGRFNLFAVHPSGGAPERLTTAPSDHASPVGLADGRLFFVGWENDRANLYEIVDGQVLQRSDVAMGIFEPAPGPDGDLWATLHAQGRKRPVRVPTAAMLEGQVREQPDPSPASEHPRVDLSEAQPYRGLSVKNWQAENLFGVAAAGPGGIYGQIYATASDMLRDRTLVLAGNFFGSLELTDGYLLYLNQAKRLTWGGGAFQSLRFRVDRELHPKLLFQSGERFFGALVSARLPIDRFVYVQLDQALGATKYFLYPNGLDRILADGELNGTGENLLDDWKASWGGVRPQTETTLRLGFDTVRYHYKTGPLAGAALLIEGTAGSQPLHDQVFGSARVDGQAYVPVPVGSGSNLGFKASAGTSGGGEAARSFFLSSYDTLRAAHYGDHRYLLGKHFWFGSAELQVPLDAVVRVALASTLEGVVAVDVGGVADDVDALWDRRILDVVVGGNVVIGPLVFRAHFARALDIGGVMPEHREGRPWVPNLSLTWLQR